MQDVKGFAIETPIFPDLGCAKDYILALQLGGLERRKRLAELLEFGCVKILPWLYYVSSKEMYSVAVQEETVVVLHRVIAILDGNIMGDMPGFTSEDILLEGWMMDDHIAQMTEEEFREELRRKRENSK